MPAIAAEPRTWAMYVRRAHEERIQRTGPWTALALLNTTHIKRVLSQPCVGFACVNGFD